MTKGPPEILSVTGEVFEEPVDTITPVTIVHEVDDFRVVAPGAFYNFLTYRFERDGLEIQARAYLDAIDEVSVLTEEAPSSEARIKLLEDVLAYLKRRYGSVRLMHELSGHG